MASAAAYARNYLVAFLLLKTLLPPKVARSFSFAGISRQMKKSSLCVLCGSVVKTIFLSFFREQEGEGCPLTRF